MSERPLCECHGEPQYWRRDPSRTGGGRWQCSVLIRAMNARWREKNRDKVRELNRRYREENPEKIRAAKIRCYENLSILDYNRRLLRHRRLKALKRMTQRNDRLAEDRLEASSG